MKIQICSDLHLEFPDNRNWLKAHPLVPKGDVLLIAGDTYYLNRSYHKLDFIKRVADEFEAVYLIPGNHEYYEGYDSARALEPFRIKIMDNVFMVNNERIQIGEVQFIFSTLWSNIQKHQAIVKKGMVDFYRIKFKEADLSIEQYNSLHKKAFDFVSKAVDTAGKKVVVSHHLPSSQCNVEEFKDSPLNEAFCVEKTAFIQNSDVDYWIYGHSHRNKTDFQIGKTQLITNQLGYVAWNENGHFDTSKVIEL
ncbi:MAG: metallophosphoesterase [Bacteroidota bacterium]